MSLEQNMADLTSAVNRLTATILDAQKLVAAGEPGNVKPAATEKTTDIQSTAAAVAAPEMKESDSEEKPLTYDDIKEPFLKELVAKKGREAGAKLLKEFGVPDGGKLSDIPADKWADVLAAIRKAMAS